MVWAIRRDFILALIGPNFHPFTGNIEISGTHAPSRESQQNNITEGI